MDGAGSGRGVPATAPTALAPSTAATGGDPCSWRQYTGASGPPPRRGGSDLLELRQPPEEPIAGVDLRPGERAQAVEAEGLHAEGRERAAHDHGPAQGGLVHRRAAREVAHE